MQHRITVPPEIAARARARHRAHGGHRRHAGHEPLRPRRSGRMSARDAHDSATRRALTPLGSRRPSRRWGPAASRSPRRPRRRSCAPRSRRTRPSTTSPPSPPWSPTATCARRSWRARRGVIAGVPLACEAFRLLDDRVAMRVDRADGTARVTPATWCCASTATRAACCRPSGWRSTSCSASRGSRRSRPPSWPRCRARTPRILDTRKTTPGWRALEKYAVRRRRRHEPPLRPAQRCAHQGQPPRRHRRGRGARGGARARPSPRRARRCRWSATRSRRCEPALAAGADARAARQHVARRAARRRSRSATVALKPRPRAASRWRTVRAIAESGVDRISVGALTHSAPALDLALDFDGL